MAAKKKSVSRKKKPVTRKTVARKTVTRKIAITGTTVWQETPPQAKPPFQIVTGTNDRTYVLEIETGRVWVSKNDAGFIHLLYKK
jgi:hypothetical protein